jgi:hypothetical protein
LQVFNFTHIAGLGPLHNLFALPQQDWKDSLITLRLGCWGYASFCCRECRRRLARRKRTLRGRLQLLGRRVVRPNDAQDAAVRRLDSILAVCHDLVQYAEAAANVSAASYGLSGYGGAGWRGRSRRCLPPRLRNTLHIQHIHIRQQTTDRLVEVRPSRDRLPHNREIAP